MEVTDKKQTLEEQELNTVRELNTQFGKLKMALGEIKLREVDLIEEVKALKNAFTAQEKKLVEKYGADSVINTQTGEVTKKE